MKQTEKRIDGNAGSPQISSNAGKLSDYLQQQVCRFIGEYWGNDQIIDWLNTEHAISLDSSAITYYRQADNHQDAIQRARAAYNSSMDEQWSASSRNRLDKLEGLYKQASKDGTSPARRRECQSIIEQMATECPGMAALAADTISINIPEHLVAGTGGVPVKVNQPDSL